MSSSEARSASPTTCASSPAPSSARKAASPATRSSAGRESSSGARPLAHQGLFEGAGDRGAMAQEGRAAVMVLSLLQPPTDAQRQRPAALLRRLAAGG